MAIIGEIRDKGGVAVLIFVGLSLIAFLLMDATSSSMGATAGQFTAGSVNGKEININTLNQRINSQLDNVRRQTGNVDDATEQRVRQQVWDSYAAELVADDEFQKLGIAVSDDEMTELMMGTNPHPFVKSSFTNPQTNQFDNSQLQDFILGLSEDDNRGTEVEKRANWENFRTAVERDVLNTKYKNLVKKGSFVPDFLALNEYYDNNNKVSFDYFVVPFSQITDGEVEVSDSELSTYLTANKSEFGDEAKRSITYVEFPIVPTKRDTATAKKYITDRKSDFAKTDNDVQYLSSYSDLSFNDAFVNNNNIFNSKKKALIKARKGDVVGPYFENGQYILAKIIDKKQVPDSVECRHILINPEKEGGIAVAELKADSILNLLKKKKGDFDVLAELYSEDKSNSTNGGYLNWAKPNQMVKPFNDLIFYDAKPKAYNKVQTQFGWHIVQVMAKRGKNASSKIGYLAKAVEASSRTNDNVYSIANKFAGQNRTPEAFQVGLKKADLIDKQINGIGINDYVVEGIQGNARDLVKWAFESQLGQVSDVFSFDDKFVVAKIDGVRAKGDYSVAGLRNQLTEAVRLQKKGTMLSNRLAKANGNIDKRAKAMNVTVKTAENVTLKSARLIEDGFEPAVIGKAFTVGKGKVSAPIKGNKGIYVVKINDKTEMPATTSLDLNKNTMKMSLNSRVDANLLKALTESVEVEDNRHNFY